MTSTPEQRNSAETKRLTGTSIHEALEATINQAPTPEEAEKQIRDILTAAVDALVKISGVPTPALIYVGSDERIYRLDDAEEVHFAHPREAYLALGLLHAAEGAAQRAANRHKKPRGQSSTYPAHQRAAARMLERDRGETEATDAPGIYSGVENGPDWAWIGGKITNGEITDRGTFAWVDDRGDVQSNISWRPPRTGYVFARVMDGPDKDKVFEGKLEGGRFVWGQPEGLRISTMKFQVLAENR